MNQVFSQMVEDVKYLLQKVCVCVCVCVSGGGGVGGGGGGCSQ